MMLFDYYMYLYLQIVFMGPAYMINKNDEVEKFTKHFSLNGMKPMCAM